MKKFREFIFEEIKTGKIRGHGEDFDDDDEDFQEAKKVAIFSTGMSGSEGPTHIVVYENKKANKTFIEPSGEYQNSPPFYFKGTGFKEKDLVKHINKLWA